jgi:hypothetical protein
MAQYQIVRSTAQDLYAMCTSTTDAVASAAVGVLLNDPGAAGREAQVCRGNGLVKVIATTSGNISFGDFIACSTAGHAMPCVTANDTVIGRANQANTAASGALVEVHLFHPRRYSST